MKKIKSIKSVEEKVEDYAKSQLSSYGCTIFSKTDSIDSEIDSAMRKAPSKSGGDGGNYPDIRLLLEKSTQRYIPVMIEAKGTNGKLVKLNAQGEIDNTTAKGEPNYSNINSFAANGAVHYAKAIIDYTESHKEVIAIGINGYMEANTLKTELAVYYVSDDNFSIPKRVGEYSDLSFLSSANFGSFIQKVDSLKLTTEELEAQSRKIEEKIEISLKSLNQSMQDDLQISVGSRVELITGMIMAGLGVKDKVAPLEITELKGQTGQKSNDGMVIINKISDFLTERELPQEKRDMLVNDLSRVFVHSGLYNPDNGESKLKKVYIRVKNDVLPIFTSAHHLDFTGKLFNVLNEWVDIPDSDKNDVVLTPRYVTTMMARLAKVDRNSYVWDYAAGSAGFLISSMNIMLEDAKKHIKSPNELSNAIAQIKTKQLLGIEKRSDIYMLAVLNMILMGDGSSNILHKNSLTEYSGNYEWGTEKDKPFPANVFLLNPPYSADGKGFIFVKKALERMSSGRAVVLIQESAGSGSGLPFTKELLRNNTLVASIRMASIFSGKASVQTAVYVFDIGKAHNKKHIVKFIDMSNDGYSRQNRKKSGLDVNLRNTDNAHERYQEVVDLVNYGRSYLNFFTEDEYVEDTITLNGNDWMFAQHKQTDTTPCEDDFQNTIKEYLSWKTASVLRGRIREGIRIEGLSAKEKSALNKYRKGKVEYIEFQIGEKDGLFDIHPTKAYKYYTNATLFKEKGNVPVASNSSVNNGIGGYSNLAATEKGDMITFSDTTTSESIFYQPHDYIGYPHVQGLYAQHGLKWEEGSLLYFVTLFRKCAEGKFDYANKFTREIASKMIVKLPVTSSGKIDFAFMCNFMKAQEKLILRDVIMVD
jgi:hypothetical protein